MWITMKNDKYDNEIRRRRRNKRIRKHRKGAAKNIKNADIRMPTIVFLFLLRCRNTKVTQLLIRFGYFLSSFDHSFHCLRQLSFVATFNSIAVDLSAHTIQVRLNVFFHLFFSLRLNGCPHCAWNDFRKCEIKQ